MNTVPRVAVLGRQNVGKSTLVNRLVGRREAIAHESPGVTRDRIELEAAWRGSRFVLVDTGGYAHGAKGVEALVARQAEVAAAGADLVLLVVDARAGLTEEDAALARRLRRSPSPVLVVANKVDGEAEEADAAAFHALGLGEPLPVSAANGRGAGDLLDRVVQLLPEVPEAAPEERAEPRFAIVGRPNVGKSSLFNRLVRQERSLVFEQAGTTRDAVDAVVEWPEGPVRFVDTAGMRRAGKVRGVEFYSLLRAARAIERAGVVVLVVDAPDGFTVEEKKIAVRAIEAGRALVIAANKWDLVTSKERTYRDLVEQARAYARAPVVRTSAVQGQGVHRLPPVLLELHERWLRRVGTARVNEVLQAAQAQRPTSRATGTLHYATQVAAGPPTFVVFGGVREPDAGYRRYLEHRLRAELGLDGVPIRLRFRGRRSRGATARRPRGR